MGYNYLACHYEKTGELFPNRVICATESKPGEIEPYWNAVKQYPYLIGDFVWTSMDYIGEAGIGKTMVADIAIHNKSDGDNQHGKRKDTIDPEKLEVQIVKLLEDDVTRTKDIYEYLLTGNEKSLSIRTFDKRDKQKAYERQKHKCAICGKTFKFEEMHADHIIPWSKGGKTVPDNCQMLCTTCNIKKSTN